MTTMTPAQMADRIEQAFKRMPCHRCGDRRKSHFGSHEFTEMAIWLQPDVGRALLEWLRGGVVISREDARQIRLEAASGRDALDDDDNATVELALNQIDLLVGAALDSEAK